MLWTEEDIRSADRIKRLNIINSISGIKPANLVGTLSPTGNSNLAIFSSAIHLGSNPALIGLLFRPQGNVPRNSLENLLANGFYTINHVSINTTKQAHYTSAKFDSDISEFDTCKFEEEYLSDFRAPFVKYSPVKIGMRYKEHIPIEANGTTLVIGSVVLIEIADEAINAEGYLDLEALGSVGIGGLNRYYTLRQHAEYPYARANELPRFKK